MFEANNSELRNQMNVFMFFNRIVLGFILISTMISQVPTFASNDIVGKVVAGYQGWFACAGDGSPVGSGLNRWVHWSGGGAPSPGHQSFEIWPDTREWNLQHTYQTGYANLGNGEPARLYASDDKFTVDTHVRWMREYGIDCAALQRFGSELQDSVFRKQRDQVAKLLQNASERNGRKFYIMYDISGWKDFSTQMKLDWTDIITRKLKLTSSKAYAHQDGKPVVCIWGFGFGDRDADPATCIDLIGWFKQRGCYVIGGVPTYWRTSDRDSKPGFLPVYEAFNMVQPWTVGRYSNTREANLYAQETLTLDRTFCADHHLGYQPVVFPGFSWSNWNGGKRNAIPRMHGDFLWNQFCNLKDAGISTAYVAMFDEFDEGTAIAKAAEDKSMIPTNQYFQTLDADGVHVSSDFYLRVVHDAAKMLSSHSRPNHVLPTPFTRTKGLSPE